jgi:S1-C subfamily serine protease
VIPALKSGGEVQHAYIGITTAPVPDGAKGLPTKDGALVQDVAPGSPAADAGFKAGTKRRADGLLLGGDIVVKVDNVHIRQPQDVAAAIADNKPGDRITIEYYRGRTLRTAQLTLGKRPKRVPGQGGGGQTPTPPKGTKPKPKNPLIP